MASQHPEYIQRLIDTFAKAQQALIRGLSREQIEMNLTLYEKALLQQVEAVLVELNEYGVEWARTVIPEQYVAGVNGVVASLQSKGIAAAGMATFARLHTRAIDLLIRNAIEDLTDATNFVGRQIRDNVRQAGLDAIAQKLSMGQTVKQAKRNLAASMAKQGINGIRDRRGRMISLDAYASTVARSTTREATNTATKYHLQALGYDLVKMSSHATTCPLCAALQGRVYSLSGNTPGYPVLTRAFGSHANIHPNCRHVITPYIPELADDPEGDRAFSNRPFEIDERSQAQIDRYNRQQRELRELRNDRNQYQRYKLVLGDDVPKTFSGFRRMKQANSERWRELTADYREAVKQ